jgi:hypothetical protein
MAGFDPMVLSRRFEFRILNHRFHNLRRFAQIRGGRHRGSAIDNLLGMDGRGDYRQVHWLQSCVGLYLLWFSFCLRSFGLSRIHGA